MSSIGSSENKSDVRQSRRTNQLLVQAIFDFQNFKKNE